MNTRLELKRNILLDEMNQIHKKGKSGLAEFSNYLIAFTAPLLNVQEESKSLLPRQYACSCNVIKSIVDNDYEAAWWELQDIVTASNEEVLTYSEMWLICMLVESMMENLR